MSSKVLDKKDLIVFKFLNSDDYKVGIYKESSLISGIWYEGELYSRDEILVVEKGMNRVSLGLLFETIAFAFPSRVDKEKRILIKGLSLNDLKKIERVYNQKRRIENSKEKIDKLHNQETELKHDNLINKLFERGK